MVRRKQSSQQCLVTRGNNQRCKNKTLNTDGNCGKHLAVAPVLLEDDTIHLRPPTELIDISGNPVYGYEPTHHPVKEIRESHLRKEHKAFEAQLKNPAQYEHAMDALMNDPKPFMQTMLAERLLGASTADLDFFTVLVQAVEKVATTDLPYYRDNQPTHRPIYRVFGHRAIEILLTKQSTSTQMIDSLAACEISSVYLDHDLARMARHPKTSPGTLAKLVLTGEWRVQETISARDDCPPALLEVLVHSEDNVIRGELVDNDNITIAALDILCKDSNEYIRNKAEPRRAQLLQSDR